MSTLRCCGLVLGGLLLIGADAHADTIPVQYFTSGRFVGGTGNNVLPTGDTYASPGGNVTIQYFSNLVSPPSSGNTTYELDFGVPSFADFGTFRVTSPLTISQPVSATFILDIIQVLPVFGELAFVGSLQGQLRLGQSGAFVQFEEPLSQSLGLVIYTIIHGDGAPGRVALKPTTLELGVLQPGETTIQGQILVIPEPSTALLMGMGAVVPLALMCRRRLLARTAA